MHKIVKITLCIILILSLVTVSVIFHRQSLKHLVTQTFGLKLSMPVGTFYFKDVCIERLHDELSTNTLVAYNSKRSEIKNLQVVTGRNVPVKKSFWVLHFTKDPVPQSHTYSDRASAYFIKPECEGNLHHFWNDFLIGLYGLIKYTSALVEHSDLSYVISELKSPSTVGCYSKRYSKLLYTLPVANYTSMHNMNPNTCFRNAFFGFLSRNVQRGELENHIKQNLNITQNNCIDKPKVVLQDRVYRRLTNIEQLPNASKQLTHLESQVILFEDIALEEQVHFAHCAKILIGIQGAGLEWFRFMQRPAWLVEIGWNKWPAGMYSDMAAVNGYNNITISNCTAEVTEASWDMYSHFARVPVPKNEDQKRYLLRRKWGEKQWFMDANIWKYANCALDMNLFKNALHMITQKTQF